MAENSIPYVMAYGNINKALEAIKLAQTPDRFTQDFLANRLQLKGGTAKTVIPFLKKTAFLSTDGTPTEIYKKFRNPAQSGAAAATGLKSGFSLLYEINERVHELSDEDLKGLIVQATGIDRNSSTLKAIFGSFKALRTFADFTSDVLKSGPTESATSTVQGTQEHKPQPPSSSKINLGYTINLNLPATSDVAVFDAIFTSLRQHLMN